MPASEQQAGDWLSEVTFGYMRLQAGDWLSDVGEWQRDNSQDNNSQQLTALRYSVPRYGPRTADLNALSI